MTDTFGARLARPSALPPVVARPGPLLAALLATLPALALAAAPQRGAEADLIGNFRQLSTMRPRACAGLEAPPAGRAAVCAWHGRLRLERWQLGGAPGDCVTPQAAGWAALRRSYPGVALAASAWRLDWRAQTIGDDAGAEKRLAVLRRLPDGRWQASQWTWHPSGRLATRRWQAARWQLLQAQAARLGGALPAASDGAPLWAAWERHVGAQPAEIGPDGGRWQAGARCFGVDMVGVAHPEFRLPYLLEDSRLEQRSAMQLQLARRYPAASWLQTFRPIDPAHHGSAVYMAMWSEGHVVRGQLWMPTRRGGPVLRLRVSTGAPASAATPEALAPVARALESELGALARQWWAAHD